MRLADLRAAAAAADEAYVAVCRDVYPGERPGDTRHRYHIDPRAIAAATAFKRATAEYLDALKGAVS